MKRMTAEREAIIQTYWNYHTGAAFGRIRHGSAELGQGALVDFR